MQILGFINHRHPVQCKLLFSQHMLEKAERVFEFGFETKTEDFSENVWLKGLDSSLSMSSFSKSSSLEKRHENRREKRKESSPAYMAQ